MTYKVCIILKSFEPNAIQFPKLNVKSKTSKHITNVHFPQESAWTFSSSKKRVVAERRLVSDTNGVAYSKGEQIRCVRQNTGYDEEAHSVQKNTPSNHVWVKAPLPIKHKKYTVLRSPHIDKKSREQFGFSTHKACFSVVLEAESLPLLLHWIKQNQFLGVQMTIKVHYNTTLR